MANDCLVTKLKGVVNNENLETMGVFRMKYYHPTNTSEGRTCLQMFGISEVTIISGDAYFIALDNTTKVNSKTITTNDYIDPTWYYFNISNNADCIIEIKSKYNLSGGINQTQTNTNAMIEIDEKYYHYIGANSSYDSITIPILDTYTDDTLNRIINTIKQNVSFYTNQALIKNQSVTHKSIFNIVRLDKVIYLTFGSSISGSASDIAKFINLRGMTFLYKSSILEGGLLSDFGKLTKLEHLQLGSSIINISGSIEDFVVAQRTNGRTECVQLRMPYLNMPPGITWKGSHVEQQDSVLSWTATTITLNGDTINA